MSEKYKSEIIREIIEKEGHVYDSLHYESECIKTWIDETTPNYPKLTDYESEWLYYKLSEQAVFPYVTFNGTSGTVENVVPYAYKRAILKGQTLVNVLSSSNVKHNGTSIVNIEYSVLPNPNNKLFMQIRFNQLPTLVDGANRFLKLEIYDDNVAKGSIELPISNMIIGQTQKFILDVFNGEPTRKRFTSWMPQFASGTLDYDIVLIEYQQGMENWDIPFFEGMQSVKMPVLTTTGKNLYTGEQLMWTINSNNTISPHSKESLFCFRCKPNTTYTFTTLIGNQYGRNRVYECYEEPKVGTVVTLLKNNVSTNTTTITTSANAKYIVWQNFNSDNGTYTIEDLKQNAQIEENSVATSYEPYKSNILTVNEPVELRGIGDVRDTLDLLTGEVRERIGEIVLDGSENWETNINGVGVRRYFLEGVGGDLSVNVSNSSSLLCDKFKASSNIWTETNDSTQIVKSNGIYFIDSSVDSLDAFVNKLKTTNIKVQYSLIEKPVKTVDLSVTNQDGETLLKIKPIEGTMHIETSGTPINPILSCEVPVEAITQNLASFLNW